MRIAEALREWFRSCEAVSRDRKFNVDYLPSNPTEYAIYMSPSQINSFTDITGEVHIRPIQSVNFIFASRNAYSASVLNNLANLGFYDEIIDWIIKQSKNKNFPEIEEGTIISIVPSLTQYLFEANADSGRYQIQCKLTYRRK